MDGDEISILLLLCFAFTYEREMSRRERMLLTVQSKVAAHLFGFSDLCGEKMRELLEALRKGGER
jgi:predicted translin family RNA/ssDNA-binding protein